MEAYEVRLLISALLDPQNRNSYTLFLDLGSTPGSFHQFPDLVKPVLGQESAIAETLALYVPKARRSHIAYNMSVCFPGSTLSDRILKAFILRRDIENFLLQNKPEQFFGSREFDKNICIMFPKLVQTLLNDHEKQIGIKLAAIESADTRAKIKQELAGLSTMSPFKLIADIMTGAEVQQKKSDEATNPHRFMPAAPKSPKHSDSDIIEKFLDGLGPCVKK